LYREKAYGEARTRLERALEIQQKDNPMHPTTLATIFKLACIALQEESHDEAL
jgi:hypothetical protein